MYVSANRLPGRALLRSVPANVLALGWVSLVTDISSEMVTAVLPVYLLLVLGLSPWQLGFLDGLYLAVASLVRLAGAGAADRWQRRKAVAAFGYGVSALAKLGLLLAGASLPALATAITADRSGKGLRTAPRDALISLSTSDGDQGRSFGVHRAMDTLGALLGPLAAFGVLAATGGAYSAVFVVSGCVAGLGVVLLLLYVRDRPQPAPARRAWRGLLTDLGFRRVCLVAALLGAVTISDFFLYLVLQQQLSTSPYLFPLLPLGTAASYLLLAVPLGRLADRRGRVVVFVAGHAALGLACLLLGLLPGPLLLLPVLVLHGAFYAATDGVLMAAAGSILGPDLRTSGMAALQTVQALARFASSLAFGSLWALTSPGSALLALTAALALALALSWNIVRKALP